MAFKPTKQDEVIEALNKAWNLYNAIPKEEKHSDDDNDFRYGLHNLQRIVLTQMQLNTMRRHEAHQERLLSQPLPPTPHDI